MSLGKNTSWVALSVLLAVSSSCSSGSSGGSVNTIVTAIQDLGLDPDGETTVLTFRSAPGAVIPANFEADGGQTALSAVALDDVVTIVWDARVTPSHEVRATGIPGASSAFVAVATSDASVPTFAITDGVQNPGLGGDTVEVTFSGPRVVPDQAEDIASWELEIGGQTLDLTGSVLTFDEANQVLDIVLGTDANLHAAFTLSAASLQSVADVDLATAPIAGVAAGDAVAPTLVAAEQNLGEDEYGRVVDFTFDEAMDPVFSTGLSHFGVPLPEVATSVEQPSEDVLRVTFSGPVVPGVDTVTLNGLVDAHGNAFPNGPQPIDQPSPVANAYDGSPEATTVENALGDTIVLATTQALDPEAAEDAASWTVSVDGSAVTMADQELEYDFLAKTLTIRLDFDMRNGDAFDVAGNAVLEVDGEAFAAFFAGVVSGDAAAPSVTSVTQNRTLDQTGETIDVQLSEDVDETEAENLANWSLSGGPTATAAQLLASRDVVRLTLDLPAVPGDVALTASGLEDLAGNAMAAPQGPVAIASTDVVAPQAVTAAASAVEGADDDTLIVTFDDDLVEAEVEDPTLWTIESPIGDSIATAAATVVYDAAQDRATLTFGAGTGVALRRGDDFQVSLATVRDIGGNAIDVQAISGEVEGDSNLPSVHTIWRDSVDTDAVEIRFTEPCGQLDDLYDAGTNPTGTRYVLRNAAGVFQTYAQPIPAPAVVDGGLGVHVYFGVVVQPTDRIDVLGAEDLAGNPLFPALMTPTVAEDGNQPSLDLGMSTLFTVSGERNDVITVIFDRPMSPWRLLDADRYTIETGGNPIDLSGADLSFDGDRMVTIDLRSSTNLTTGAAYDISIDDVLSAQGVLRSTADTEVGVVAGGDAVSPTVAVSQVRLDPSDADALLIQVDEAVDETAAETAANYDYGGGNLGVTATRLGPRTIRVVFGVTPAVAGNLDLVLTDLAGNATGVISRAVTAADASHPLVASVAGFSVANAGGDYATIAFNEAVELTSALDPTNYVVHNDGQFLDVVAATREYDSAAQKVVLLFDDGDELDVTSSITVTIQHVADFSGNAMPSPVVIGNAVGGDTTPPDIASAFVDWRLDPTGLTVDVLFTEEVDPFFAGDASRWSASGGQTVVSAVPIGPRFARVSLSAPLSSGQTLDLDPGLTDLGRNAAAALTVTPEL